MVRAKFICTKNNPASNGDDGKEIELMAVVGGENNENDSFFKYTPSGSIVLQVVNDKASEQFEVGKEYYIDFTPTS